MKIMLDFHQEIVCMSITYVYMGEDGGLMLGTSMVDTSELKDDAIIYIPPKEVTT